MNYHSSIAWLVLALVSNGERNGRPLYITGLGLLVVCCNIFYLTRVAALRCVAQKRRAVRLIRDNLSVAVCDLK